MTARNRLGGTMNRPTIMDSFRAQINNVDRLPHQRIAQAIPCSHARLAIRFRDR